MRTGAPVVGKSTTSQAMAKYHNAFIVPEVNLLFARPQNEPKYWYLNRQVARWEIGIRQLSNYDWIIYDGDLFQPLWFSWIYSNENWTNLDECAQFYREQIIQKRIAFPDIYLFLFTSREQRWLRELKRGREKGKDKNAIRNKFERYEKLVEPQKQYFQVFQSHFPEKVRFLDSVTVESNLEFIKEINQEKSTSKHKDIEIIDFLVSWLREQ